MAPVGEASSEEPSSGAFDYASLLAQEEAQVREALRRLAAGGAVEDKAFSDCRYLSLRRLGLSCRLTPADGGSVDVVFLYNEGVEGHSAYALGALPAGIDWADRSRDVVAKLGEPSDKYGGGRMQVGISYETLGVDVHFQGPSWDDAENQIASISFFGEKDQMFDMCVQCAKQARFHCGHCHRRRYCSSVCQKAHWPQHQAECGVFKAVAAKAAAALDPLQQAIRHKLGLPPPGASTATVEELEEPATVAASAEELEAPEVMALGEMD